MKMRDLRDRFRDFDVVEVPELRERLLQPPRSRQVVVPKRHRSLTFVVAAVVAVGGFLLVFSAFDMGQDKVPSPVGNPNQGETYTLTQFRIGYPYKDRRRDGPWSDNKAAISFIAEWPEGGFPGTADCELTLTGRNGQEVGTPRFDLVGGKNGGRSRLVVPVTGEPTAATGSCLDRSEEDPTGPGYVITGPTEIAAAVDTISGETINRVTELTFDVEWDNAVTNPGLRTCYLIVARSDGTEDPPVKYNLLVGQSPITFDVEGRPDSVSDASVTCGPFEE
jgi:hypothetical protein